MDGYLLLTNHARTAERIWMFDTEVDYYNQSG